MSGFFCNSRALYSAAKAAAETPTLKVAGIMKEMPVSCSLVTLLVHLNPPVLMLTKKIWDPIKANNLQNLTNKSEIICYDKLKKLFDGRDKIGMLEIAKLLSPHFLKAAA